MIGTRVTAVKPIQTSKAAIEIHDLDKAYRGKQALHAVNLEVQTGEFFGLIGPDGAGKTTILQILAGVLPFDSGSIQVLGKSAREARKEIGYVTQQFSLYAELSIDENLRYVAGAHNVLANHFQQRKITLLKKMGLSNFGQRLASQLSGGMKQKLALCCALIAEPKLLLLDEPTVGIDPVSRLELWELLDDLRSDNTSIIVATPYYEEADRCNRVALLSEGTIQLSGSPQQLKKDLRVNRLELFTDDNRQAEGLLRSELDQKQHNLVDIYTLGDHLDLLLKNSGAAEASIKEILAKHKIELKQMRSAEPSMENVFYLQALKPDRKHTATAELNAVCVRQDASKSGPAIRAQHLSKCFGRFNAVNDVSLEIAYGEIYGLLGANGAGKTTTIKILCGLQSLTSGKVQLAEESVNLRSCQLRKRTGYMSQKSTLYADLTVQENLEFYSAIYEIPIWTRRKMINWALCSCGLESRKNEIIATLPKGLKQRVAFAAAVMHSPEILFLDEPTSGIDPAARRQLWHLVHGLAENGTAILITTHGLDEAEYCNRLGIMVNGELLREGTASQLKDAEKSKTLEEAFINLVRRKGR